MEFDDTRLYTLNERDLAAGPVVYWMSREQRADNNWSLLYAADLALRRQVPLIAVFVLVPAFMEAGWRQYHFMLKGLQQTKEKLEEANIPLFMLKGDPAETLPAFLQKTEAGVLVSDFDPLPLKQQWQQKLLANIDCAFLEVDGHNIIPCRIASNKQEYAARTLRPKVHRQLERYLQPFPPLPKLPAANLEKTAFSWQALTESLSLDKSVVPPVYSRASGPVAAGEVLARFLAEKLDNYDKGRNDPVADAVSGLSPYIHFGQISAQKVALEVAKSRADETSREAFLEQLIVRRELAENYCFWNPRVLSLKGAPNWALKTLDEHLDDERPAIYTIQSLEPGNTEDDLWNAAQRQLVHTGSMHGYLRMYWAKKILSWYKKPETAFQTALYLNDRYQLDGRDPNGYTGIAWAMGGVHDRPWPTKPVFGKVRSMSYSGCARKFDIPAYINHVEEEISREQRIAEGNNV